MLDGTLVRVGKAGGTPAHEAFALRGARAVGLDWDDAGTALMDRPRRRRCMMEGTPRPRFLDLLACCALVASACAAYAWLPGGSALRMAAAISVLFFAPGYLLIEAVAGPVKSSGARVVRAFLAIGVSPAIVGLLALGAGVLPGGFRPVPILILLAVACGALAVAGFWRRRAPTRQPVSGPVVA